MNEKIINIAVIAHVDHGKTTLVDALLKQSHVFRDNQEEMNQNQILDRNELERERGITILAKNCSIFYENHKINIIDTPGHADFSGEVERTLGMADGALLIVDAQEGPMPQTRYVLKKALEKNLKIIVVINKIDKKFANPTEALNKVESLFLELAHSEDHLNFPVVYAIGARGVAFDQVPSNMEEEGDITPLLNSILKNIPLAQEKEGKFKMLVSNISYDSHLGRLSIGRIYEGKATKSMKVCLTDNPSKVYTVEKLKNYEGLNLVDVEEARCGDIIALSGVTEVKIGQTIADQSDPVTIPSAEIAEPTINLKLGPNTSPLAGREGKFFTSRQIEDRLNKELESNLSLRLKKTDDGKFIVSGRGELHLAVLLETLRREGFELEVGKPEVIIKEIDNVKCEPVEEVSIIVPADHMGVISEEFGKRYSKLIKMDHLNDTEVEFIYHAPTRVLIGLRNMLLTLTKGTVVYNSMFLGYEPLGKEIAKLRRGVLIASEAGDALGYGLANAQERGIVFIEPAEKVYEGMIIGLNSKEDDISVNVCKGKKLTNMRSKSSDGVLQLTPATKLSLEQSLDFLETDELLEITPENLRLRKKYLTELERKRHKKV